MREVAITQDSDYQFPRGTAEAPFLKLRLAATLSAAATDALRTLLTKRVLFDAGETIVDVGDKPTSSLVLLEGMASRVITIEDGSRQMVAIGVPGDWIDLQSYFLQTMDHSLLAVSRCAVASIPHPWLKQAIIDHPTLMQGLWREMAVDGSVTREWAVNAGARGARRGMAHILCEMHERLKVVGLACEGEFFLPLTQGDLADALGISAVHTNRVLQFLRRSGLVAVERGKARILDWKGLCEFAEFNPHYLHQHEGPDT